MKVINGTYNNAKIFTDIVDDSCEEQIKGLLDLEVFKDAQVRIMPDCHAGASCVIGFTANLGDKVIPNIVGVDIGCGMLTIELGKVELDFDKLDDVIRKKVPYGRDVNEGRLMRFPKIQEMFCYRVLKDTKSIERAIGSLGGGNHFIEVDMDEDGCKYLVIHTGSRQLGKQVVEYYQKVARGLHTGWKTVWDEEERIKKEYKEAGRRSEIQEALKELHRNFHQTAPDMPLEYSFLYGEYTDQYLHDMKICQEFADENRKMIARQILDTYGLEPLSEFATVHNYIDHDSNIIRKGAVSAQKGEKLLIPINMRDGSLLCVGKGNEDWNYSAPHGAGRLFSRSAAKYEFTVEEYAKTMKEAGIYSSCIDWSTLDECPMAYKGMEDIVNNIEPTADIIKVLKPLYNFKATSPKQADFGNSSQ
jgi:RNA-splicing ligase RtcB